MGLWEDGFARLRQDGFARFGRGLILDVQLVLLVLAELRGPGLISPKGNPKEPKLLVQALEQPTPETLGQTQHPLDTIRPR